MVDINIPSNGFSKLKFIIVIYLEYLLYKLLNVLNIIKS